MSEVIRTDALSWATAPPSPTLTTTSVHVWRATLDLPPARVRHLAQVLSDDERERAERFSFERDRARFTVGRGLLRAILARYLRTTPARLCFTYGPHGKPALACRQGAACVQFNVAHSAALALVAVALERPVGVDIEQIRPLPDLDVIARRFFAPHEAATLRTLPADQRNAAFFTCWTRKEACIKAWGTPWASLCRLHARVRRRPSCCTGILVATCIVLQWMRAVHLHAWQGWCCVSQL